MFSLRKPGAPLAALLMAGLLVAPGVALGGKVYIWTDEKGEKHITDKPPAQAPADMKSLSATPNEGRPASPDAPALPVSPVSPGSVGSAGGSGAILPGLEGAHMVDGVLVGPDGQPVPGPDGQPVRFGPDGQMQPAVQSAPDPRDEERVALQRRLEELQKEKEAYDLANRRARSVGDGYAKQRSRYHQNEVEGRINEVESRLKLLDADGDSSGGDGGQ
ncbi:MAG TPA: DUF4124 domain-containing protein [Nitratidesulfovibrio sp.]|nr:DUF4124 domain-containing protein [Nitratidesulfovibrio sp.]